ncbi:hypothetical protein AX16_004683 [Volvariella volvacea WC 439]|nr:hypothetical protein AX16_004683 [Volvariella volvacea WC 439]
MILSSHYQNTTKQTCPAMFPTLAASTLNANPDDEDIYKQIDGVWFKVMVDYVLRKDLTWKKIQYFPLLQILMRIEKGIIWVLTLKLPEMEAYPEYFTIVSNKGTWPQR